MPSAPNLNVDLHCHSTVSDGVLEPHALARRAHANGVQMWALTDHDEVSGLPQAGQVARELGMQFVPGIEISVTWSGKTVHIVGLGIDAGHAALNQGLVEIRTGRVERARKIADRLRDLGVPDSYEGALAYAGNPLLISRTHFARFMVERGYCKTMQAVFDKYLGDHKPANVSGSWAKLANALAWIHDSGGRAVIAHPGRYNYTSVQFGALFDEFKQLGGEAIEVITGSHSVDQYRQYADVARRYGFMASCGSDFHSPGESRKDLGSLPLLPADLRAVWHDWV
ncbi:3',5'-nucleoside bisphosphate phosphatase [Paralcaligenes ginsengisoli]